MMRFCTRAPALVAALLIAGAVAAEEPAKEKAATVVLVNKAKDIHVISERDEPILDYFRRTHVLIGAILPEELAKVLKAKEPLTPFFVNYASQNDDPTKASTFGANLELMPPTEAVAKLLKEHKGDGTITLILRRDDKKADRYAIVGYTERTPVGFFDNGDKNATDGFSQKDLCYKGEQKK